SLSSSSSFPSVLLVPAHEQVLPRAALLLLLSSTRLDMRPHRGHVGKVGEAASAVHPHFRLMESGLVLLSHVVVEAGACREAALSAQLAHQFGLSSYDNRPRTRLHIAPVRARRVLSCARGLNRLRNHVHPIDFVPRFLLHSVGLCGEEEGELVCCR
ncbi:hypothetical protein PFISCL1PPCAC_23375, partial [Pristionchus fissidentatus]